MAKRELSAKDRAFEKERATYRGKIRELEAELQDTKISLLRTQDNLIAAENKIQQLEEQVKEALAVADLPEDTLKHLRKVSDVYSSMAGLTGAMDVLKHRGNLLSLPEALIGISGKHNA